MESTMKAILFDTRSIQKYIFSSNQLKTNIGASFLVEKAFAHELVDVLRGLFGEEEVDAATWRNVDSPNWTEMKGKCRIGYIGGGNALVLFREGTSDEELVRVVQDFTRRLLWKCPGLRIGAARGELVLDESGAYRVSRVAREDGKTEEVDDLTHLVHKLKAQQNLFFPAVSLPYTGLTLSCEASAETANAYDVDDVKKESRFLSWEVKMKLQAARKKGRLIAPAEEELLDKLRSVLTPEVIAGRPLPPLRPYAIGMEQLAGELQKYAFPVDFDKLGQRETEDYMAIVHIDGNNMGEKFRDCSTLTKRKNLSFAVRQKSIQAFCALLTCIVGNYETLQKNLLLGKADDGKNYLPVRPIVLGGDDMTFVCPAKYAVAFTNIVLEALNRLGLDSCGGVSILPTAYPFFRGYEIAEQLCGAAKGKMRQLQRAGNAEGSCWLDFAILHGEQPPTLEQIRAQQYKGKCGAMHFGPYRVDGAAAEPEYIGNLLEAAAQLVQGKSRMPMNKIKELRAVLAAGEHEQQQFMAQYRRLAASGAAMRLPDIAAWEPYRETLWQAGRTPYVDAIEMIDFYVPEEVQHG
ncbi:hypothetical protein QCO44_08120 [Selenomonas sputigena]|uniref:Uncharacterized protein n=1 Tax=Selenomonas sputigena TaxID=69823 RepID=A0ABV3X7P8_9FIRM